MWLASDEASLYLQATTMAVWSAQGVTPQVFVVPDRTKTCFYGTLNLHTGQETVQQTPVMNAVMTAQHLQQLLDTYPTVPIKLLWDRAPWHQGRAIRQLLQANPRLELIRLPVACPALNPQEHVWKATRRAISHNHLEPRLPELATRFENHLKTTTFPSSFLERYNYNAICPRFM